MKIKTIEPIVLKIPFDAGASSQGFGDKPWTSYDMLVVRIETDNGLVGWGEAWGYGIIPATRTTIADIVSPHLIGREVAGFSAMLDEVRYKLHLFGRNGTVNYSLAGIEIALWDIWGKANNLSIHELLGGARRLAFEAYASLLPYRGPDIVAEISARAVDKGYAAVKLHEIEMAPIRAARAAIGPDVALTVDTNCPWTLQQAKAMARQMADCNIMWLEEPIWPPENFSALAELNRESGIAIAAGENVGSVREFSTMLSKDAVSYVQPSVTKIGGITEMQKVFVLADAHNVTVAPHSPYFGPGFAATLHLAATLPYAVQIERVYVDLEASPFAAMINLKDGRIAVPRGPGLGIEPDIAVLTRYRVA
ncbi:mandelate racemase/muconate lactonizing enzyme family protein [Bradyrhizobium sp. AUGA SZCCT0176]|uniref:mandelate racemase/muconate lactonizing enzyme family protein n=1 Tax=unclassified Bradyrhizobium TaxID=2631580 RepID=UPI001BADF14B|nr:MULTISPECIES: mandelate racemase/muconate lactonizing enzyme family protein [unclassified Bradyrhizobium]MBR1225180.1 mandelate racemase/muconate lactonizing enzyme family protein [Bradyrhizobium sp. AUGA SZCCT0176]MBR1281269.1 mandelate racemase/muconate lactonizing enzyme family protein [Bradyrhizobium sp. AUGA SZCCT0177]